MSGPFSFLIVAGGGGSRIGGLEKQFRALGGEGKPLWRWSVDLAASAGGGAGIEEIVLVLPQGYEIADGETACPLPLKLAPGGTARTESVKNGLEKCTRDYVMVHDAARPFASAGLIRALADRTTPEAGAVPVLPVAEAVKRIGPEGQVRAVDREGLYATQTPQSFPRESLIRALGKEGSFKDEAEAWLAAGLKLHCVEGERMNFKVTWPEDLRMAEAMAGDRDDWRTGIGYDVHRLTPERRLILGGVAVPSPLGLLGHSDADVLAHAVADALLGAAGLPDIGNLFPASDGRYKDADSMELLRQAVGLVRREQWDPVWADAVLEAQVPRLNAFLPAMRERLSEVLNPGGALCVNVKAKSAEMTGDPGAGRSIVCRAVATLRRRVTKGGSGSRSLNFGS